MFNIKSRFSRLTGLLFILLLCLNIPLLATTAEEMSEGFETVSLVGIFICLLYLVAITFKLKWIRIKPITALLILAFITRIVLASIYRGHLTDMRCWTGWSISMAEHTPINFYSQVGFGDYPPGYLLVLWPLGILLRNFGVPTNPAWYSIVLKLPIFIFDILAGVLVYKYATKKNFPSPLFLTGSLLFNPAVIFTSAIWGQVDMVLCFFVIAMIFAFYEQKLTFASLLFVGGLLIKPQMFLFGPVFIIGYIYYFKGRSIETILKDTIIAASIAIIVFITVFLPFVLTNEKGLLWVFDLYFSTMGSYSYASVNAINFMSLLNGSWEKDSALFMGITYKSIGTVGILLTILYTFFVALRDKSHKNFALYGALMILGIFTLGHNMHERYIFPAIICLFVSYMYVPNKPTFVFMILFSIMEVLNMALVLQNTFLYSNMPIVSILSLVQVVSFIAFCVYCFWVSSSSKVNN